MGRRYNEEVVFSVSYDCRIIGPSTIRAEAGIASILLQVGSCNTCNMIIITAKTIFEGSLLTGSMEHKIKLSNSGTSVLLDKENTYIS